MPRTTRPLYTRVREILKSARARIARYVNTTQVVANWLVGRELVEEEQKGAVHRLWENTARRYFSTTPFRFRAGLLRG